jgi:hypothetical protein
MDNLHSIFRQFDPEDVERLMTEKKEKKRKLIIRKFLFQTYLNNYKNINEPKQLYLLKNTFGFCKIALSISFGMSYIAYQWFFTGIYEFRKFYFNTKTIPIALKIGVSMMLSYHIFMKLLMDYTYNYEIYELAVNNLYNKNKE